MATITEPTKIKLEFKEAVYMYGGDYNQGYEDGKDDGFEEGKQVGYDEGVEVGKANAPREERSVTYKANGSYEVLPTSSELLMEKVNVVVDIPDDGSYSEGYAVGYSYGEAYGKANAPTENLNVTLKSNGTFNYPKPSDKYYADVAINVSVPSEKTPTQEKSITIRENGTEVISPDTGYVLEKVTVITDIPERLPTQTKTIDIEENGTEEVTADSGYALEKVIINTDIDTRLPEQTKEVTIKENGTTNVLPDSGYTLAGVSVTTEIDTRLPEQEKSLEVTENKTYEVVPDEGYALAKVTVTGNVASSGGGDDGQLVKFKGVSEVPTVGYTSGVYSSFIKEMDFSKLIGYRNGIGFFSNYLGQSIDLTTLDTSNMISFDSFFSSCYELRSINFTNINTSNVGDFSRMFQSCLNLTTLDLTMFDTRKVTNMYNMFSGCSNLKTLNISSFNTEKCSNYSSIFSSCRALEDIVFPTNFASNRYSVSLDMKPCPLSKDTILDLANKLADKSDTTINTGTYKVTLKSSQQSLFTEDELTALAGQFNAKNWTLAWG